jgi:CRP-like cAMP-binding protein
MFSTSARHDLSSIAKTNHILAALPSQDLERICVHLRPTLLQQAQVLYHPGQVVDQVYFITGGVTSNILADENSKAIEIGLTGAEGMVGAMEVVTDSPAHAEITMQVPGKALVMPAAIFGEEFRRSGVLLSMTLKFMQAMLMQASQCILCNQRHSVEQRLARWLLMVHDRVSSDEMELTQEFLSIMLGVRRVGVTGAATTLKKAGLIEYARGVIRIKDREGLEESSCACYAAMRRHFAPLGEDK